MVRSVHFRAVKGIVKAKDQNAQKSLMLADGGGHQKKSRRGSDHMPDWVMGVFSE